eukprot:gnl/Chilomastix_cuspidata/1695.p1 GENE.gnl/Chilomastix_cuspidata/1695~~gnl/Chilomastix_cuspidata/1695.p1  ORF type:complete len:511 (-),score=203.07 gnl/Chilomastix_cuspidata/1695:7-1539(-)
MGQLNFDETIVTKRYGAVATCAMVFNIAIGMGSLTIPQTFADAGLLLSTIFMTLTVFFSWIVSEYVYETLAICCVFIKKGVNYYTRHPEVGDAQGTGAGSSSRSWDSRPLLENGASSRSDVSEGVTDSEVVPKDFEVTRRIEFGMISEILWGPVGHILMYIALILYFLGDIAIYASGFAETMESVIPIFNRGDDADDSDSLKDYYVWCAVFIVLVLPLSLIHLENTKVAQMVMTVLRNAAFLLMIVLELVFIFAYDAPTATWEQVGAKWEFSKLPALFGDVVYSFMTHHSLPNLMAPLDNKRRAKPVMAVAMGGIYVMYFLLAWPSVFAFYNGTEATCTTSTAPIPDTVCALQDMINNNFANFPWAGQFFAYFLGIYPAFIVIFNSMLIVNTCRSNLLQLIRAGLARPRLRWFLMTCLAVVPSWIIAMAVGPSVSTLVDVTGGVLGMFIMFVFPSLFVFFARRQLKETLGVDPALNPYRASLSHFFWVVVVWVWIVFAAVLDVINIVELF